MDAYEFLEQPRAIDQMIKNKLEERMMWKVIATGTTAQMGGERVQCSGSKQKMADATVKFMDIERQVDEIIDQLIEAKCNVISVIQQINNTIEYDVLHKLYIGIVEEDEMIKYLTLQNVADMYGMSYNWAKKKKRNGVEKVQRILDRTESAIICPLLQKNDQHEPKNM